MKVVSDRRRRQRGIAFRLDIGTEPFAKLVIGYAEHRTITNPGHADQHALDLGGIDIDAAGDHHVALAVANKDIAIGVDIADVAGSDETLPLDLGAFFRLVVVGEIYSRIATSPDFTYHNKPEKRTEIEREGFITSGDVGYIDADGYVFICDRKRDMVISGGVNIYPAEIEAVLHAVPGVHDCAVFGIPDEEFGEALMAVVEPQAGVLLEIADIRARLKASLADYKVPKHVEIQTQLPREDSGKIFKRRLRDPYWERAGRRI